LLTEVRAQSPFAVYHRFIRHRDESLRDSRVLAGEVVVVAGTEADPASSFKRDGTKPINNS
jgi:hypothetical protein